MEMMNVSFELFLVALGFSISIAIYKWTWENVKRQKYPLPPGPPVYPIVGCLPEMLANKPTFRWIESYMQRLDTEIACFRLGGVHVIPVSSPELAGEFFREQDAVFGTRPESMSARITSNGFVSTVLAPTGDQWRKMRRVMALEVHTASMHKRLYAKRREEADHLVRYVHDRSKIGGVNVREAARLYCGCVTRKLVFGKRFFGAGAEDGGAGIEEREHMAAVWVVLSHTYGFAIADYVPFMEIFDLDGQKKILTNAVRNLRKYQDVEVDNRVEMWRNGVRNTNEDILHVMISLNNSNNDPLLSIEEIKTQIMDIFLGGIDNPSNVVEWALAEMISKPRTLDLATKELDRVVGKNRLVQESDLSELNYIKACAKEALRLHPVAPFNLPHMSTADTVVGGYSIPKGSHVLLSRLGLGRNPRVWEDPLKFRPDRHIISVDGSPSQVAIIDPEQRMWSFGVGRRGCPAIPLGSTIITMLMARLLHSFTLGLPSDVAGIDLAESRGDLFLLELEPSSRNLHK